MPLDQSELDLIRDSIRKIAQEFGNEYWRQKDKNKEYPWDFKDALASGAAPMAVSLVPLSLGASASLKWGIGGVVVALAGAAALTRTPTEPPQLLPARPVMAQPTVVARPEPKTNPPTTSSAPPRTVPTSAASRSERDAAFTEELRLVKLAKGEIDAGRAHLAEVWLAEHAQRFPNGVFRAERDALRILVACAADPAGGERTARHFVTMNPHSPLVDRISRACGLGDGGGPDTSKIDK